MKYLVLPILIILGIAELLVRGAVIFAMLVITFGIAMLFFADNAEKTEKFMVPVSFKLAERIV